jgi:hypothetical protein
MKLQSQFHALARLLCGAALGAFVGATAGAVVRAMLTGSVVQGALQGAMCGAFTGAAAASLKEMHFIEMFAPIVALSIIGGLTFERLIGPSEGATIIGGAGSAGWFAARGLRNLFKPQP